MTREEIDALYEQAYQCEPLMLDRIRHFARLVAAAEREACVNECLNVHTLPGSNAMDCATAIRARGKV